jgi:hypothetical protein
MSLDSRKPDTRTAMHQLIAEVRAAIPFDAPASQVCSGECNGCAMKLLEYLDGELSAWEQRLEAGETPHFGDLSRLGNTSRKVRVALKRNGLIPQDRAG